MTSFFSSWRWRDYTLLPTAEQNNAPQKPAEGGPSCVPSALLNLPKRYTRLIAATLIAFAIFWFFDVSWFSLRSWERNPYPHLQYSAPLINLPPLYPEYRQYEERLAEETVRNANGSEKYMFFANHAYSCGWGNVLQEMIFSELLAVKARRGFVWDDYTWNRDGPEYSDFNGKKIPSRIPLSTMLSGHILGQGPHDGTIPRSIYKEVYYQICPENERVYIERTIVEEYIKKNDLKIDLWNDDGMTILNVWLSVLQQPEYAAARCVEVKFGTHQVFDIWLLGSTRLQNMWPDLRDSPILRNWGWSPLIHNAFARNVQFFVSAADLIKPSSGIFSWFSRSSQTSTNKLEWALTNDTSPLPVLALHVRRGDFSEHCKNLAGWTAPYTGFNSFPESTERDGFISPQVQQRRYNDPKVVSSNEEREKIYKIHCYPDAQQITKRVREVVKDYEAFVEEQEKSLEARSPSPSKVPVPGNRRLNKVYVMTNGDREWLKEVKAALEADAEASKAKTGGEDGWDFEWTWEGVHTSRDLDLGWEDKPVAQALDMFVAQRAELFVGNGFSSLTANIVMLRMNNHLNAVQTRFW
ncbi:hypothetical protein NLJ89_g5362 [Agrocybe chaxingu]|uniref:Uncharacterized protein n=1 Tax=Agrocybe chaxingu TaxID=84603 RepID=A0A9W8K8E0_9AGAR|nr:hypothetical protein NLJ89_g5362 [Agrocybe chaxingu]